MAQDVTRKPRKQTNGSHISTSEANLKGHNHDFYVIRDAANGLTVLRDDPDDTRLPGPTEIPKEVRSDEYRQNKGGDDTPHFVANTNPHDPLRSRYRSVIGDQDLDTMDRPDDYDNAITDGSIDRPKKRQ